MKKFFGVIGRGSVKTAEVLAVGAIEVPKVALIGTKYLGKGIEATGRGITAGSQYGIDGLSKSQDTMEAKSADICASIADWEAKAIPVEVVEASPEEVKTTTKKTTKVVDEVKDAAKAAASTETPAPAPA